MVYREGIRLALVAKPVTEIFPIRMASSVSMKACLDATGLLLLVESDDMGVECGRS